MFMGPFPTLVLSDPDMIQEVLTKSTDYGASPTISLAIHNMFGGPSLISSSGHEHKSMRSFFSKFFRFEELEKFAALTVGYSQDLMQDWDEEHGHDSFSVDLQKALMQPMSASTFRFSFGMEGAEEGAPFRNGITHISDTILPYIVTASTPFPRLLLSTVFRRAHLGAEAARSLIKRRVGKQVQRYLDGSLPADGTMLNAMAVEPSAESPSRKRFSVDAMTTHALSIFFGGYENTSILVSLALYLLAKHPEWQRRLKAEIASICLAGSGEGPSWHQVKEMPLVRMTLYETLRIYQLTAGTGKVSMRDTLLCGLSVPAGMEMRLRFGMLCEDQKYWREDIGVFNPMRFRDGQKAATTHTAAFMPFSAGAKSCLGRNVALMQSEIVLVSLLQSYVFECPADYEVKCVLTGLLKPRDGVHLTVRREANKEE
jgi:cytochrome P450